MAAPNLANLIERDGSGVYQRLMARALEPLDVKVESAFYPYRRALQMFEQSRVDCLLSLTDVVRRRVGSDAIVYSYPLGRFSFHIFTLAENPPVESLEALEGRVVGSIKGHELYLGPITEGDMQMESVRSEAQAVRMLKMGRLDALIAALPDIRPHLDRLSYAPDRPLLESYDRINCHDTAKNRAFVQALSRELRDLKEKGVYQEVMGALYMPFKDPR
ncbi:substrate-binding periplasmic protein [Vreelandella utahensis]|uniref:substrate-binding periplasmic protein n=1 Tax=Vreelandella halophila TaxID=86177 RepID=UPI0015C3B540|nr:transporter substrate-binding domain-containing protein [Halomonas utahensis]